MRLGQFDYFLPKNLIAQKPAIPRDSCRLMVLDRKNKAIRYSYFSQIDKFLKKGDVIVLNNTKIFPARMFGKKETTDSRVEILLLRPIKFFSWDKKWRIIGKPNLKIGQKIKFPGHLEGRIIDSFGLEKIIEFNQGGKKLRESIFLLGKVPIPPYIKSNISKSKLVNYYQTIYAQNIGSVAGPTAGFHFTKRLIKKLEKRGVVFKFITLHIGLGTFQPINTEKVEDFKIASEWAKIDKKTADFLNQAKKEKRRIISVGTTTTRTLEGFFAKNKIIFGEKNINIFIYPGYKFKVIDALITNFHLPKSSTLLLTCAFGGRDFVFKAYEEAIKRKYRFYSFGDSVLII